MTKATDQRAKRHGDKATRKTKMEIDSANDRSELTQDESKTTSAPGKKIPEITPELVQAIRLRAYELYEQRGEGHGHDSDDWLQAEAELTGAFGLA
jgi:hypothetical protein